MGSKPASQHQDALARRPRLSIQTRRPKARVSKSRRVWLDTRVSASRRVRSTPASQHQGALARHPRLSCNYPNYGASHRTHLGKWPLVRGRFQGARSPPETPINSPVCINKGAGMHARTIIGQEDYHWTKASSTEKERRLFSELTAY